ncbi:MAG TPA: hypothetical protein VG433_16510 [Pirellulales bacterium]|jgi:F0F1-type ATP synthase assembly protein I|nr:hypothetical protein [Pirellulales bacterium]
MFLPPSQSEAVTLARGFAGALLGAVLGWLAFSWMAHAGFYSLILVGALTGLGTGLATGRRSIPCAVLAALIGAAASMFAEWRIFPFRDNDSFPYFLAHMHQTKPQTLLIFTLGIVFAAWFGLGRNKTAPPPA